MVNPEAHLAPMYHQNRKPSWGRQRVPPALIEMSFRPGIPGRVALQQSPPPLSRPDSLSASIFRSSKDIRRTATVESRLCLIFGLTSFHPNRQNSTELDTPHRTWLRFFNAADRQNSTQFEASRRTWLRSFNLAESTKLDTPHRTGFVFQGGPNYEISAANWGAC
jgi:hypothetical protein